MSLIELSATALVGQLQSRKASAVDVAQAFLSQAQAHDSTIGAFLRIDSERVLAQSRDIDRRRAAGESLGKLAGVPVAVKDLLAEDGERLTCASKILENFRAPYDSTVVRRLKAADAVLFGRTNMDEFAMGGSTENSAYQKTRNPWNPACTPGGSSGGAAACIAASMAPLSIGSDTGGSIRQPAAMCGVTGLKPTYGRVSRFGLVAFASSLDQVGPLAWSAEDAALLLEAIAGHDPLDSTSVNMPVPEYSRTVKEPLKGLKLGWVPEHFAAGINPEVERSIRDAIKIYESLGAKVREVSLPHSKYGVAAYYIVAPSEASSNLARYDGIHYGHRTDERAMHDELEQHRERLRAAGNQAAVDALDSPLVELYRRSRAEGFGAEVKRRIMLGTYALSAGYYDAYYLKALKVRRLIRNDFDQAFQDVDLIIGPVTTHPAFEIAEKSGDPLAMYLVDLYTVPANLAGIPGISIPCGFSTTGLPIGLQLQAPPFEEDRLLRAAAMFQRATDWHTRRPKLDQPIVEGSPPGGRK
jgi:aspartyl-tRNA(Asn)/glutamyl-tRNA(Gln) amidotransferase subunit A